MRLRTFLLNGAVIGSLLGLIGTLKATKQTRTPWRSVALWGAWAMGLVAAVVGVMDNEEEQAEAEATSRLADVSAYKRRKK